MNISISCRYSLINDEDINKHVKKKINDFPNIGWPSGKPRYITHQNMIKDHQFQFQKLVEIILDQQFRRRS